MRANLGGANPLDKYTLKYPIYRHDQLVIRGNSASNIPRYKSPANNIIKVRKGVFEDPFIKGKVIKKQTNKTFFENFIIYYKNLL